MSEKRAMYADLKDELLLSREQIAARVKEMGQQITEDFRGKDMVVICILKGGVFFMTDLSKHVDPEVPVTMDFMAVSSYGTGVRSSSGIVRIVKDLDQPIEGRDVLVVEDIIDSGLTMQYLKELFSARKPASVTTVSFLDKAGAHPSEYKTDLCGFEIGNEFVVGYGLDYANYYRNLPYIGILRPECYAK